MGEEAKFDLHSSGSRDGRQSGDESTDRGSRPSAVDRSTGRGRGRRAYWSRTACGRPVGRQKSAQRHEATNAASGGVPVGTEGDRLRLARSAPRPAPRAPRPAPRAPARPHVPSPRSSTKGGQAAAAKSHAGGRTKEGEVLRTPHTCVPTEYVAGLRAARPRPRPRHPRGPAPAPWRRRSPSRRFGSPRCTAGRRSSREGPRRARARARWAEPAGTD
jgi:hypothetical protein